MMEEALKRSPKNPRVLTVISNLVLATANDDSEQVNALRQALLKGVSPGVAHFVRGTGALMQGDYKMAEREWSLAQYYDYRREFGGARYHYQQILENFDDTPFAPRAQERIQQTANLPDVPPQQLSWLVSLFPSKQNRVRPLLHSTVPQ